MLRIVSKTSSPGEFIEVFRDLIDGSSVFVVTREPETIGCTTEFSINLSDGEPMLCGVGEVVEAYRDASNSYNSPGMRLRLIDVDENSQLMLERLVTAQATALGRGESALGSARAECEVLQGRDTKPLQGHIDRLLGHDAELLAEVADLLDDPPSSNRLSSEDAASVSGSIGEPTPAVGVPLAPALVAMQSRLASITPTPALSKLPSSPSIQVDAPLLQAQPGLGPDLAKRSTARPTTPPGFPPAVAGPAPPPARPATPSAEHRAARPVSPSAQHRAARPATPSAEHRAARPATPSAEHRAARPVSPSAQHRAARPVTPEPAAVAPRPTTPAPAEAAQRAASPAADMPSWWPDADRSAVPQRAPANIEHLEATIPTPMVAEIAPLDDAAAFAAAADLELPQIPDTPTPTPAPTPGAIAPAGPVTPTSIPSQLASPLPPALAGAHRAEATPVPARRAEPLAMFEETEIVTALPRRGLGWRAIALTAFISALAGLGAGYVLWGRSAPASDSLAASRTVDGALAAGPQANLAGDGAANGSGDGAAGDGLGKGAAGDGSSHDAGDSANNGTGDSANNGTGDGAANGSGDDVATDAAASGSGDGGDTCEVSLASNPEGAAVFLDDRELGETPLDTAVPCGTATFTFRHPRYRRETQRAELVAGTKPEVSVQLRRPEFSIKVVSSPPRATVLVDGKEVGKTPTTIQLTGFSKTRLQISKSGYRSYRKTLYPKRDDTLRAKLTRRRR